MRAIDIVRQNFYASSLTTTVPEWCDEDGNPMIIHYSPMTGHDSQSLAARGYDGGIPYIVAVLILKALDEDGKPLFTWGDHETLMSQAHLPVIVRITDEMRTQYKVYTVEDAKKNSKTTKSLPSSSGLPQSMDGQ